MQKISQIHLTKTYFCLLCPQYTSCRRLLTIIRGVNRTSCTARRSKISLKTCHRICRVIRLWKLFLTLT